MKLNDQQQQIVDDLTAFLAHPDKRIFCLGGYSGTGKSTSLRTFFDEAPAILRVYESMGLDVASDIYMCAPTHKAVEVIRGIVPDWVDVTTMFSLFSLVPKVNKQTFKTYYVQTAEPSFNRNSVVMIDESSMLGAEVKFIKEAVKRHDLKLVLIGDPDQLVNMDGGEQFFANALSQYDSGFLTQLMRNDSSIAVLAHRYRKAIHNRKFPDTIKLDESILYMDKEDFKLAAAQDFSNKVNAKVLTYKRDTAEEYNKDIHKLLGNTTPYSVGQLVTFNDPQLSPNDEVIISNNEVTRILDVTKDNVLGIPVYKLRVQSRKGAVVVNLPENKKSVKSLLREYKKDNNWREYYKVKYTFSDVSHAYATTTHKSQGSTYDHVYIDLSDLGSCHIMHLFARLMYVAISRATTKVIFTGTLPNKYIG